MIKLVVIDIDGTLLNSQHQLSERNENALKKAIEQGVQIAFATGKTRHAVNALVEKLNLNGHGIFLQGLAIHYPDGSVRHNQTLEPALLRRVITFAEDRGFDVVAYAGSRILVRAKNQGADELAAKYHEPTPEAVGALQNIVDSTPINKLIIIKPGDGKKIKAMRWQLNMQLNNSARLMQAAIPDQLEVLPPGASKGKALKTLIKELSIPADQVLAIGDAENDIEMVELAGIGVAVGNASENLKAVADYVVASNDDGGVAEALERFVLKKEEPPVEPEKPAETTTATSDTSAATTEGDKPAEQTATETPTAKADEKPTGTSDTPVSVPAETGEKQAETTETTKE